MEIINIEKQTLDQIIAKFEAFAEQVNTLCDQYKSKQLGENLDNQDVCLLLNISPRTLQTYRDTGKISFSQVNHKIYYKSSDIQELLNANSKLSIHSKKQKL